MSQLPPNINTGIASAACSYIIWGFLPIYWKLAHHVPALEILAHRIFWSFIFLLVLLVVTGKIGSAYREVVAISATRNKIIGVITATFLITLNWFVYIWAVNNSRIIETSLGYYINPLVSVLLGVAVLQERLSFWQVVAVLLAGLGVLYQIIQFGVVPWISLSLAFTFGLYGLCKKMLHIGAITGITLETLLLSPIAFAYLTWLQYHGQNAMTLEQPFITLVLIGSGAVTAVPLLLFTNAANRLPLTILGFVQYLSPTIALFVGIFLYREPFSATHFTSFACIWSALALFSFIQTRTSKRHKSVTTAPETAK